MAPQYTGKGRKRHPCSDIRISFKHYSYELITLSVASFNQRAIYLYQQMGFETLGSFQQKTNGGEYVFLRMKRTKK
jgi:ribosomal protein S18 acetylase RimI-like enzyme